MYQQRISALLLNWVYRSWDILCSFSTWVYFLFKIKKHWGGTARGRTDPGDHKYWFFIAGIFKLGKSLVKCGGVGNFLLRQGEGIFIAVREPWLRRD